MFIVLEGIDKVGKTSLANHINKLFGLEIVKFSQPKKEPYIEYMEFLTQRKLPAVLDRFYLGEMAYGPVKRGKAGLNEWQLRNIEMLLQMRMPLCIYCYTNPKEIAKNFKKENEEYLLQNDINPILFNYANEVGKSRIKWHQFNYLDDKNYEKIDQLLLYWYKYYFYNYTHFVDLIDNRTLGRYDARTLVLGEISHIELEQERYKQINVGFANGPSAEILYNCLPSKGKHIAISNLKKAHLPGLANNGDLLAELTLPKLTTIVCLGKESYNGTTEYLKKKQINHLKVKLAYHPAYVARGGVTSKLYEMQLKTLIV